MQLSNWKCRELGQTATASWMLKSKKASNKKARENWEESVDRHDLEDVLREVSEKFGIIKDIAMDIGSKKVKRN